MIGWFCISTERNGEHHVQELIQQQRSYPKYYNVCDVYFNPIVHLYTI